MGGVVRLRTRDEGEGEEGGEEEEEEVDEGLSSVAQRLEVISDGCARDEKIGRRPVVHGWNGA